MNTINLPHYTFTKNQEKYIAFTETHLLRLYHQIHTKFPNEINLLIVIKTMLDSIAKE